ncbi:MAG: hypothetical protein DMG57_23810, partial [Acidobacteria bacterium]
MRKPFVTGFLIAATFASTVAFACGDKLMLLVGGGRFRQVYARTHPASILAYARQNSAVPEVIRELGLEPALKQTGYKFFAVEDRPKLDEALKTGKYDLVLLDVVDAEGLEQQVRSAPSMPFVLPVVHKFNKADAATVHRKFHCILKAPGSIDRYLAALDEAMI